VSTSDSTSPEYGKDFTYGAGYTQKIPPEDIEYIPPLQKFEETIERLKKARDGDKMPDAGRIIDASDCGINIQMTPMVRVLLEMPEEDALWLRNRLARSREENLARKPMLEVVDNMEHESTHDIEVHVKEILIYG
jgi:hypothetical protein